MPSTTINPTRMELTRLKGRLKTAQRGHKLLKDKRDELMKQFMDVVRENRALRRRVEEGLMQAHSAFTVAAALMSPEMLEQALLYPKQQVELDMTFQNIMSVDVPRYEFRTKSQEPGELEAEEKESGCVRVKKTGACSCMQRFSSGKRSISRPETAC